MLQFKAELRGELIHSGEPCADFEATEESGAPPVIFQHLLGNDFPCLVSLLKHKVHVDEDLISIFVFSAPLHLSPELFT